jgi:hypothetical protein
MVYQPIRIFGHRSVIFSIAQESVGDRFGEPILPTTELKVLIWPRMPVDPIVDHTTKSTCIADVIQLEDNLFSQ